MTIEELKRARKRLGMTQKELAEALGMQTNSVTRMEMGFNQSSTSELSIRYLLLTMSKNLRRRK